MIPAAVANMISAKLEGGWNGRISLNVKDGVILDVEIAEKHRIQRETDLSRATNNGGGSHAGTAPR